MVFVLALIMFSGRRKAAVGEFCRFFWGVFDGLVVFVFRVQCVVCGQTHPPCAISDCTNRHISTSLPSVPRIKANPPPSPLPGRVEIRIFLILYFLTLPFQLITTGAVLEQGTKALVILTAIHAGLVAALFWGLLANALVATQVVEDGTVSSLVVSLSLSLSLSLFCFLQFELH